MTAGSRSSRCGTCHQRAKCSQYSKKANQLSWLVVHRATVSRSAAARKTHVACLILSLFLVLTSLAAVAQTPDAIRSTLVHGLIVTAHGQPVARAVVQVLDLRGITMAMGFTDNSGRFALTTPGKPGVYLVLAEKELQIGNERVTLDQTDRAVTIELPATAVSGASTSQGMYTVSAQELSVPAKARVHLKLARQEFSKSNFAEAEREIAQALKADSIWAAPFCMRALLRLASKDLDGAIEDALHALALDPDEADAYVALATAYNSLSEFGKAEAAARAALGMRPDSWQGRLELAKSLYGEAQFVLALRELDGLDKDFPDVHLVRADVLQCLQRSQEAAEEFRQFLREAPNDLRSRQIRRIVSQASMTATPASSRQ
jgi:tetratricopeptide (TPR) repeat protein